MPSSLGLTFDTGALIALERRSRHMAKVLDTAARASVRRTVPAPVIIEWWRGRSDIREDILAAVTVEETDEALARLAGEAMAKVHGATAIDALVMASAARRGDVVYTADVGDLERLRSFFPGVRLFRA